MRQRTDLTRPLLAGLLALSAASALGAGDEPGAWPGFRGPGARGVAEGGTLPATFDVPAGVNVLWSAEIPGLAHSSPAVWGDRIFLTTAVATEGDGDLKLGLYGDIAPADDDSEHRFEVLALDRDTGEVLWRRTAHVGAPRVQRHTKSTHANPTPATDGRHVAVSFGSEGLYVYDVEGELLWERDLGKLTSAFFQVPDAEWGFASSPVIHGRYLIVQADVLDGSFLAAFDVETGDELWRTSRDDVPTWSTPTVVAAGERLQVVVNGFRHAGGYALATGEELWRLKGTGDIPVPTPFVADGLIILSQAHGPGSPLYAVHPSASGDVTPAGDATSGEHVAWSRPRDGAYIPTPVAYDGLLYVLKDNGVLSTYEVVTGEEVYQGRAASGAAFSASPVAADGKVYLTAERGDVITVRAGRELEILGESPLGETAMATPAISRGVIYFRTRSRLVAVGMTE